LRSRLSIARERAGTGARLVYKKAGTMTRKSPNPEDKQPKRSALATGVAGYEKIMEIAFIMPAAVAVGWLGGAGLDKLFHRHWIYIAGIVLGFVAGFIEVLRSAMRYSRQAEKEERNG
jgi:F0F1-type ATP synthase assembly protein I